MSNDQDSEKIMMIPMRGEYFWQRLVRRLTSKPWASRILTDHLHRWDRWAHRITRGRWTATELLAGLPVLFLHTTGAVSGMNRITPLLAIGYEDGLIIIATKFGADHHPHWCFNLRARPHVSVELKGRLREYKALELTGVARETAWAQAVDHYPGYAVYESRARNRTIPVFLLSPR